MPNQHADWGLLILRLGLAWVFWAHGLPKIKGVANVATFFKQANIPAPGLMAWVVSLWETLGAVFLALGLFTPVVAFGFAFSMLVAIRAVKIGMAKAKFTGEGGWELEFTLLVTSLALVFTGAGALSLDAFLGI